MNLEALAQEFSAVVLERVSRAQVELNQEIEQARRQALDALNAETTTAQVTLAQLQAQCQQAQADLDTILSNLGRAQDFAALDYDAGVLRKTNEALKAEDKALEVSIAAKKKQREDAEHQLVAVQNETQRLRTEANEHVSVINGLRAQLRSIQIGELRP